MTETALVSRMGPRARGDGGQHDRGRRDDEVGAVMLPHAEDVEADLLGQLRLLDEVAHPLLRADHVPVERVFLELRERVDPDLHRSQNVPGLVSRRVRRWTDG